MWRALVAAADEQLEQARGSLNGAMGLRTVLHSSNQSLQAELKVPTNIVCTRLVHVHVHRLAACPPHGHACAQRVCSCWHDVLEL